VCGEEEHNAPLDERELLQQRTVENVAGNDAVIEQPLELRAVDRRRCPFVPLQASD